ncbi:MAG: cytochrome P460 family protein [Chloroflexi bacterium]|nr:cytochrome P460 family protein [Chloroflexota bacterium]
MLGRKTVAELIDGNVRGAHHGDEHRRLRPVNWARIVAIIVAFAALAAWAVFAAGAGAQQAVVVNVDLDEWSVMPDRLNVPAGVPVRFVATNKGSITHSLSIGGVNAQTALLAPGQSAGVEVVFSQPGTVALFCPVGGGSHRQRGMQTDFEVAAPSGQTVQTVPVPPTPTAVVLTAPGADVDRVGLPENYRERLVQFYVFDRADNRQVRSVFVNLTGAQVREGQPYPYGTILVMETYRAQLTPENQIALDASGRYIRGDLAGIFVMRKERGFGEKYGHDRTGEWEFVAYRPDGSGFSTPPERSQACAQCHLAVSDAQRDWVVRANLFFASRASGPVLPAGIGALPRTGGDAVSAAPATTASARYVALALAGLAPAIVFAGTALRMRSRRRRR